MLGEEAYKLLLIGRILHDKNSDDTKFKPLIPTGSEPCPWLLLCYSSTELFEIMRSWALNLLTSTQQSTFAPEVSIMLPLHGLNGAVYRGS